jgi:hypothetical protein
MPKIIISYRRFDSLDITMRIRDVMATRFGESSVFTDIDSIPLGVDFLDHINSVLSACDALIAIVGPRWIDGGGDPGQGVHLETDFVRLEVEAALKRKIPIIPVLVGGARMPSQDQLPDALRPFVFRNGTSIDSGLNFRNDVNRLIRSLDETLPVTSTARANENTVDTSIPVQTEMSSLTQDDPYFAQFIGTLLPSETIKILFTRIINIAIYLRGKLLPNAFFILPWLLVLAAITIFFKPDSESLHISLSGTTLPEAFNADHFGATLIALCLFGFFWLIYYLGRSMTASGPVEKESRWIQVGAVMLIIVLVIALCELQPLVLDGMFRYANRQGGILAAFVDQLHSLALLLAACLAGGSFFRSQIALLLKRMEKERGFRVVALRAASRASVYLADAAILFLLWMAYLYLAFAGIKDLDPDYVNWSGAYYHAPLWVADVSQRWFGYKTPIGFFYLVTGVEIFLIGCFVKWGQGRRR